MTTGMTTGTSTGTAPRTGAPASSPVPGPDAPLAAQRRCRHVLLVLAVLAVASAVLFCTVGVTGDLGFALRLRSRRLAALVVVGCAVAVSAVLFQTVTTNRILTPSTMGFDSLFVLVQSAVVLLFGASALAQWDARAKFAVEVALMCAFALTLFRWLVTSRTRDLYALVLVGIVCGTMFTSLSMLVSRFIDPNEYLTLQDALFAGFGSVPPDLLLLSAVVVAAVSAWALWRAPRLDVLALGRDHALNLGVDHRRAVTAALAAVTALVAVSTALVGPVAFLGLLVANLGRELVRTSAHRWTLPAAALVAVVALVGGQFVLERVFGFDTALSIVINVVGGVYFIALLLRQPKL